MFRYAFRRFPLRVFGLMALAFVLINILGGLLGTVLTAGLGLAFFLPIFLFKILFVFMLFRFMMAFVGGYGPGRPCGHRRTMGREPKTQAEPTKEEAEWREHVRRARRELDDLFPDTE